MKINMVALVDSTIVYPKMNELTESRQMSAMPIGARYRIIDFNLSSIKYSGIRNVAIFPNWNYHSLVEHVGSGKTWDLERNQGGLFILPSQENKYCGDRIISFDRIAEHIEFLIRSKEDYVLLTQGNIIWNIDFSAALKFHIEENADITQIVHNGEKTATFIIAKELLISKITQRKILKCNNISDIVEFESMLKVVKYNHEKYTKQISNIETYYEANMEMRNENIMSEINPIDRLILTKDKITTPTCYKKDARVKNTLIAGGCTVSGSVENSVIYGNVTLGRGSVVKNSILMPDVIIGENAYIENAILDKRTIVASDAAVIGKKNRLSIKGKNSKISASNKIKIAHIASEMAPYAKTGGLSEIVKTLPTYIKLQEYEVVTIIPYYKTIEENFSQTLSKITTMHFDNITDRKIYADIFATKENGVTKYFIKINDFFEDKQMYGHENDAQRFFIFSYVAYKMLLMLEGDVSIIHTHDWHLGLVSKLAKRDLEIGTIKNKLRFIHTIHNIGYQGIHSLKELALSNEIKEKYFHDFDLDGQINFMAEAIKQSDKITTVSPTYCKELQHEYFGLGLENLIKERQEDVLGILNGIDIEEYNPQKIDIYKPFDINNLENKIENKRHLQETFNLEENKAIPVIVMITRFTEAKGIDLVLHVFDDLIAQEQFQLIVLGEGEKHYEEKLMNLMRKYPENVRVKIGYEHHLAKKMYSGGDMMLMPSRFEPCGLSQMFSLRYGTLPIVRETGGLIDSITPFNKYTKEGNGFGFVNYNAHEMLNAILKAFKYFREKNTWHKIMTSAMLSDNSWNKSAKKYTSLYEKCI